MGAGIQFALIDISSPPRRESARKVDARVTVMHAGFAALTVERGGNRTGESDLVRKRGERRWMAVGCAD